MAIEVLYIPEHRLVEVIQIIRRGMEAKDIFVSPETKEALTEWCDEEEGYVREIFGLKREINGLAAAKNGDWRVTEGRYRGWLLSKVVRQDKHWLRGWFRDVCQDPGTEAVVEEAIERWERR